MQGDAVVTKSFPPQDHIIDAKTNYSAGDLGSAAEIATAINATNTTLNAILSALESLKLVKTS